QSIVNMKLLKRAADDAKKRLVLITSEAGLLPLAGAVGLHVAKSLQSKPEIPSGPDVVSDEDTSAETWDDEPAEGLTAESAGNRPIGELAGAAATVPLANDDAMETVELPDEDADAEGASSAVSSAPLPLAAKKDKRLKIPNFDRFRLWLALAGLLLIAFIVFIYFAVAVLPKATISIKTDASNINTSATLILDQTAASYDPAANVVPAKQVQSPKTYTQQAATTGQVNKGDKATGSVNMTAKECFPNLGQPDAVQAGTGVSSGGKTYITQDTTHFSSSGVISGTGSNTCATYQSTSSTDITAQAGGANYNVSSATFTVAGRTDASASGSASGGTDSIVKVVTQSDIDGAKAKIATTDAGIKQDLQNQLKQAGYYAVVATFSSGDPAITTSANVGDTADTVTVTAVVTYTMLGAHQSDLQKVVDTQIKDQIDPAKQSILSDGLDNPDIKVTATGDKTVTIQLQTVGVIGPDLNINDIKKAAAGKKGGQIKDSLTNQPGVTDVTVKMSPFWVTTAPKNISKITVTIAKPTNTIKTNANNP
ncbi:MAG TPA: hypothetical protein VFI84_01765, partial [Candidatus Saccharimonadales bacterium]|nr:hypothetical protein [Candidatus Saccharimonadales bacterium]